MTGLYGTSMFKKPPNIFQSGRTILYTHQQCMRVPTAPHPCQHLVLSVFFSFSHFGGFVVVSNFNFVALICTSIMTYYDEHLFMGLVAIYISS